MDFEIVSYPFANEFVKTVCLTFVHSLWQGLVAAILTGIFLMATRKSRPAFRYNVLVGLMSVLLVANVATFFVLLPGSGSHVEGFVSLSANDAINAAKEVNAVSKSAAWTNIVIDFCNQHASTILTVWLLVFLWKSLRATAGLLHLRRLRTSGIHAPSAYWRDTFADLTRKLEIGQRLQFFESVHVTVPMVIGYTKPIVLVPMGMLAGMPAAQVEAILLHELAHIRRRDYLVNLIQIFCENIYFFNPAIVWISYLIREEREHCCDDLAIEVSENKTSFIHALVSFQQYNLSGNLAQVAFSRKKNHLLDRIKRIINHNNKSLDAMEKVFVSISLVTAIALSAAIAPQSPVKNRYASADHHRIYSPQEPEPIVAQPAEPAAHPDTLPKTKRQQSSVEIHSADVYTPSEGVSTYNVHVDGVQYEIVKKKGKIISLDVDGKEIPAKDYGKYDEVIAKIEKTIKEQHAKAEKEREIAETMQAEADVQRKEAEKFRLEAEKQRTVATEHRQRAESMRLEADQHRQNAEQMRKQADLAREQAEQLRKEADRLREEAGKQREKAEIMRKEAEKQREEFEKKQAALIDELLQAGIIKDTKGLSYLLSEDQLIVNGEKQPAELQKRLAAKYLEGMNAEMVYNYKGRTGYTMTGLRYTR